MVMNYRDPQCRQEPATTCGSCTCLSVWHSMVVVMDGSDGRRDGNHNNNIPLLATLTTVLHVLVGEADTWSRHRQLAMPK